MDLRRAYYCLLTYDINGMDSGSAIPSTSREAFYRMPVRVPPLQEQRAAYAEKEKDASSIFRLDLG